MFENLPSGVMAWAEQATRQRFAVRQPSGAFGRLQARALLLAVLALAQAGCVQPPLPAPPAPSISIMPAQPQPPALAPSYPSWDEVQTRQAMPLAEGDAASPPPPASSHSGGVPLAGGASLHKTTVSAGGGSIDFEVVLFDSRQHTLKVIDQPQDFVGGGQITTSMRQAGAIAGVNGGFFTPQFAPMGLMKADGHGTGTWQANKLLTGAVVVGNGRPQLLWNAEARSHQGAAQFLQAGPRLVDAGKAVPSLERSKHTTRTFIATDGGQRWLIGLARGTSLGELADALSSSEIVPGFRIQRALNLDGGRSSALYYRTADGGEHSDPGWSTVRNYLGIVPR